MTDLGDQVRATTPKAVVMQSLNRIDATENEWWRIRKELKPLGVFDEATQLGNAPWEACRCIESRAIFHNDYMLAVSEGHESAAKDAAENRGEFEAEARCRIADWLAE